MLSSQLEGHRLDSEGNSSPWKKMGLEHGPQSDFKHIHSLNLWDRILHVALGKHNIRRWEATQQVVRVVRQVPHPQYQPQAHDNDLMLLKLQTKVRLGRAVKTISVASSCASPGTPCRVSGWGTIASPTGKEPWP